MQTTLRGYPFADQQNPAVEAGIRGLVLVEGWRQAYNQIHSHSSLGYPPPALETIEPKVGYLEGVCLLLQSKVSKESQSL